jgi:hypothetical protein
LLKREPVGIAALEGSDLVESPQIQEWSVPAAPVYDESLVKQDPWEQSTFTFSFADLKAEPFAEVSEPRKIRRKEFNEVVARHIFHDLSAGMTYETAITKYSLLYPEFQTKFTVNFMGKLKNGHICNSVTGLPKRKVKSGDVRAPRHIPSPARQWERLTPELLEKIIYHVDVEGMRMVRLFERVSLIKRTLFLISSVIG